MKYKVEIDGKTYEVDVEDIYARPVVAVVDGERFEVWPESEAETTAATVPSVYVPDPTQAAMTKQPAKHDAGGKHVAAPLPGVIVAILVKPGDSVSRGQELCTLEAMKMKNAIKSSREGTIAEIEVSVGDQVGHGQVLMTYAD